MKKMFAAILSSFVVLSSTYYTSAANEIKIIVNNQTINFSGEQAPIIQNGRTLVPFRAVFEKMGANVSWDDNARMCRANYGGVDVSIRIGSKTVSVGGRQNIESDVAAQIINGRTMVPLRVLSEGIGADVNWNSATRTITITVPNSSSNNNNSNSTTSNASGKQNTSRISEEEAKSIAFTNARVKPSTVVNVKVRLDKKFSGDVLYTMEFETNVMKYNCEINAVTGEIISMNRYIKDVKDSP